MPATQKLCESKLCESKLCVSKLCVSKLCGQVVCEEVVCVGKLCVRKLCVIKLCASKLFVDKLCVSRLCVDKLCVSKLCVDKLCVRKLCVEVVRRRQAAGWGGGRWECTTKNTNPAQRCGEQKHKFPAQNSSTNQPRRAPLRATPQIPYPCTNTFRHLVRATPKTTRKPFRATAEWVDRVHLGPWGDQLLDHGAMAFKSRVMQRRHASAPRMRRRRRSLKP